MASYNRVILMGNLTRDPELRYLPSNMPLCKFGLAINHRYKDKDGNQKDEVCFVDCTAWGKSGEIINQYMSKGKPLLVEGRLKLDTWTGQDGQKRSRHEVVVENFQFVGGPRDDGGQGAPAARTAATAPQRQDAVPAGAAPSGAASDQGHGSNYDEPPPPRDEDIPF